MHKPNDRGALQDLRELHYEEQMIVMPAKEVLNLGGRAMTIYLRRLREAIQENKLALTGMTLAQASLFVTTNSVVVRNCMTNSC